MASTAFQAEGATRRFGRARGACSPCLELPKVTFPPPVGDSESAQRPSSTRANKDFGPPASRLKAKLTRSCTDCPGLSGRGLSRAGAPPPHGLSTLHPSPWAGRGNQYQLRTQPVQAPDLMLPSPRQAGRQSQTNRITGLAFFFLTQDFY